MDIVKIIDTQVVTLSWHNYHLVPSDSTLYDSAFAPTPTKGRITPLCENYIYYMLTRNIIEQYLKSHALPLPPPRGHIYLHSSPATRLHLHRLVVRTAGQPGPLNSIVAILHALPTRVHHLHLGNRSHLLQWELRVQVLLPHSQ